MFLRPTTTQTVTVGVASAATTNAVSNTKYVRIVSTTDCHIAFDTTPTATTADIFLPADKPEIFQITPGHKVAAIQNAAGGTMFVTELI